MAELSSSNSRRRLQIIFPDDYFMQPTRSVCQLQTEVEGITRDTVGVAKRIIATRVYELTCKYRPHHIFKRLQNGQHVLVLMAVTALAVNQPIQLVVTQHDYKTMIWGNDVLPDRFTNVKMWTFCSFMTRKPFAYVGDHRPSAAVS